MWGEYVVFYVGMWGVSAGVSILYVHGVCCVLFGYVGCICKGEYTLFEESI